MRRFAAWLLLGMSMPAAAQQDLASAEIRTEQVAPGVAALFGPGGNIGLSYGEDGNVLIDDQFAPLAPKILAAVKAVDPDPVRFLINTHWHGDHTGANPAMGEAGAVIVAHDNVRKRLSTDAVSQMMKSTTKATPKSGLPVMTFAQGVTLHLNGDDLQVVHVPNAHTDGDAMIYWTRANVLQTGDVFFNKATFPFIDRESGGSIDGMIAASARALDIAGPATRIIPGHGPLAAREDLRAYHAMLVDVRAKVAAGIRAGRTKAQVVASRPTAAYEGKIATNGFITPARFVETIYDELKPKLQPARKR
ncbi:MBL fold metallo-hydrolase [Sphingomonas sp. LHG3443-2]|uniref:MBL fold metallo-hydrolase n=1 Tax=Sphingomonas sp. LHG3443-2 TaxID=2804639 RepID=UPI003CF085CC